MNAFQKADDGEDMPPMAEPSDDSSSEGEGPRAGPRWVRRKETPPPPTGTDTEVGRRLMPLVCDEAESGAAGSPQAGPETEARTTSPPTPISPGASPCPPGLEVKRDTGRDARMDRLREMFKSEYQPLSESRQRVMVVEALSMMAHRKWGVPGAVAEAAARMMFVPNEWGVYRLSRWREGDEAGADPVGRARPASRPSRRDGGGGGSPRGGQRRSRGRGHRHTRRSGATEVVAEGHYQGPRHVEPADGQGALGPGKRSRRSGWTS